jgi:long-chain acyl-CoA synthetase
MDIKRTFEIAERQKAINPNKNVLSVRRNGKWVDFTADEFIQNRDYFSLGLMAMGFKKGDKILTISNNRPEWNFADMGMGQLGVVHVPVYPNMGVIEYKYILEHSDSRIVIAGRIEHYEKIKIAAEETANVKKVYSFDKLDGVAHWEEIVELGKQNKDKYWDELVKIRESIDPDALMTIIYTSGTTGRSKGVMLSQNNLVANVQGTKDIFPITAGDKYLSFLPLCHVLERMVNYLVLYQGATVYYSENIDEIGADMLEIKPDGFTSVPRVLEKLYDKIIAKGNELTGIKKNLFFWAVDLANDFKEGGANSAFYKFKYGIANKLIFSKWREALGGNIKAIISGGAALQERLARVFFAAGIPVMEGYGMTETSPVVSVNYLGKGNYKFGTVGPVIFNVQVKLDEDGEICMKGPNQMQGYYKDVEKTKEIIDDEGWLHTGDIGEFVDDRFLKITDRKKEIFKLSTGKYVAPQILENRAKESSFIDQILVVGEGEKFTAAIISPAFEFLHNWAARKNISYRNNEELVMNERVINRYQKEVDKINKDLGRSRQIRKWALTCREWTTDTGELSPTLKLKRKVLKEIYTPKLNFLYGYSDEIGNLGCRKVKKEED